MNEQETVFTILARINRLTSHPLHDNVYVSLKGRHFIITRFGFEPAEVFNQKWNVSA